MPTSSVFDLRIEDQRLTRALDREFPGFVNAEMNRGYARVGSAFSRSFAKDKLIGRGAVFRVQRKVNVTNPPKGQPRVSKPFRRAGFKAFIFGFDSIRRKGLRLSTRNPLLLQREFGPSIILPKRGKHLAVKERRSSELGLRGRKAGARRQQLEARLKGRRGRIQGFTNFDDRRATRGTQEFELRLKRQVSVKVNLEFRASWRRFQPEVVRILDEFLGRATDRAQRTLERRAQRLAA